MILPDIVMQVPKFIEADVNGHALSSAIQAGLSRFRADVLAAYNMLYDPDSMPEWRLDDMAWEWNMTWYDFSMTVDIKREMVKRAQAISRGIGTPGLLKYMMEAVFETVNILEWTDYDGEPYHFMVEVGGNRAGDMEAWAQRIVEIFKPLSRVFDGFLVQTTNTAPVFVGAALEIAIRMELEGS
jgi:phage tail P2-like protein